jgi:flagellar basal-body rod protein FlgB
VALFDLTSNLLEKALLGSSRRQAALSTNVANANTPGYIRQDVDFQGALASASDAGRDIRSIDFKVTPDRAAGPVRLDGNTVDIDTEMAAMAQNALTYQALVAVQRARFQEIETVLRSN